MTELFIIAPARPPRWVARLVAALEACGVECEVVQGLGGALERWHLEIGGERGGMPAFSEAVEGRQSVEVRLCARDGDGSRELRAGCFPYASRHARTLERIADICAGWIRQELRACSGSPIALVLCNRAPRLSLFERVRFLVHETVRLTGHALRHAFEETRWDVALTRSSLEGFLGDPAGAWLYWVARNRREFLADPFFFPHDGGPQLLCETQHGRRTSLVSIDINERFGERRPLLVGDASSYPYVVDVDGEPWLVPEHHQRERVRAYHLNGSVSLAASWSLDGVAVVDPTIVKHGDRWWLFCTDQESGPNYALRVYWSHDPRGPWHGHARNPVKIDITGARPAGNFFMRDGILHRPAQDCTGRYGRAISIQRIDVLTPERFHETCVARIDAASVGRADAVGVHTLSHGFGWVAIDAQFARWSPRKPLRLLLERLT